MKGILKNGHREFMLCKDLEKVTKELPDDVVRRKTLVIQELRQNFSLLCNDTNGSAVDNAKTPCHTDIERGVVNTAEKIQNFQVEPNTKNGITTKNDLGQSAPEPTERKKHLQFCIADTTATTPPPKGSGNLQSVPAYNCKLPPPKTDFLELLRQQLQKRNPATASSKNRSQESISSSDHKSIEKKCQLINLPFIFEQKPNGALPQTPVEQKSPSPNDSNVSTEEEQQRPTVREFERERRRALREQTVLTKPLKQWQIPEDHQNSSFTDSGQKAAMAPEQRIAFLRHLDETSTPKEEKNGKAPWIDGNGTTSPTSSSTLSSCSESSKSFSSSKSKNGDTDVPSISDDLRKTFSNTEDQKALVENALTTDSMLNEEKAVDNRKSEDIEKTKAKSVVVSEPSVQACSLSSFARCEETTSKLRRFWEQRIDEYEERKRQSAEPPRSSSDDETKKWKSSEVLSASLLSTRGARSVVSAGVEDHSFALVLDNSKEIECRRRPFFVNYAECRMENLYTTNQTVKGTNGVHFETVNSSIRNDKNKFDEPFVNSVVVRESIADAHRTRQMWQQMASAQDTPNKTAGNRTSNANTVSPTPPPPPPSSNGGSLQRKAPADFEAPSAAASDQIRWRLGSGLSTQMERHIKEYRSKQGGSLVQNAIHGYEHETIENGIGARPFLYNVNSNQLHDLHQQPSNGPFANAIIDSLENEKLLFMNYVKSHPEVVRSLGINVPWQTSSNRPSSVKVELAVVDSSDQYQFYSSSDSRHGSLKNNSGVHHFRNSIGIGRETNGVSKSQIQDHHEQLAPHRYVKYSNGNGAASNGGSQKMIGRRQSHGITDNGHGNNGNAACHTTPRQWKLAEWEPPPPPCNKETVDDGGTNVDGFVDESGNVYRSAGESLIAKEIREYRAREEELRRSRSELGLPNIEDLMSQGDTWKGTVGFEEGRLRDSRSYIHLQINTENERGQTESRSPGGGGEGRPASAGPTLQVDHWPSPRSPCEKPSQVIGGGGHKVAVYPPDSVHGASDEGSLDGVFNTQTPNEGDFMPVETRIEREMEDLRRREVELKVQRQAMGMRYYPVGLAQFTPRPSLSEYSLGETSMLDEASVGYGGDGSVCTSVREYVDIRKDRNTPITVGRLGDEAAANIVINQEQKITITENPEETEKVFKVPPTAVQDCKQVNGSNAVFQSELATILEEKCKQQQMLVSTAGDSVRNENTNLPISAKNHSESAVMGHCNSVVHDPFSKLAKEIDEAVVDECLVNGKHAAEFGKQKVVDDKKVKLSLMKNDFFDYDDIIISI